MNIDDLKNGVINSQKTAFATAANIHMELPRIHVPTPYVPAKHTHDRLLSYIKDFEDGLDGEHEVGGRLVNFGAGTAFHILDVGYWGPDIITFNGILENGNRVQLVQNISQLNVLLVAMPKLAAEPRRIGFRQEED
jgi:hypothetical protein